jgi:hypothetical protein
VASAATDRTGVTVPSAALAEIAATVAASVGTVAASAAATVGVDQEGKVNHG